jgi:hypothetical protein
MAIAIRPGTLPSDRQPAVGLLARHLNPAYDAERFDWLHSRNPAGPGRFWLAVDSETGETIGTAAAFPRLWSVGGREERGWVLGDFCVSDSHRSLGPALKLQRTCLELAAESGTPFCYDFPSRQMMTVYRRLRIEPRGEMRRFARVLRVEGKLAERTGMRWLGRTVGRAVDWVLGLGSRFPLTIGDCAVDFHRGACGPEFSALAEAESAGYGVCLKRSADYLNWRYRDNPTARHEILTARRGGRLAGFAVFTHDASTATLVDLFGVREPAVLSALVRGAVAVARGRGCATLNVSLLDSHPWVAMFRRLGFRPREASPVVVNAAPESTVTRALAGQTDLFLMFGDRDS